jgi:hypothetical protein
MEDFLLTNETRRTYPRVKFEVDEDGEPVAFLKSVYGLAQNEGLTLHDWVYMDPDLALSTAQRVVADWERVLTNATLTQQINGAAFSRENIKLLERSVDNARTDLMEVQALLNMGTPDQLRRDRLLESMYKKALHGDTKAAQYWIDRVEGKIPEAKVEQLDTTNDLQVYKILKTLFPKQHEVLMSGPGTKICCCGRRAGKTHLVAGILLINALYTTNTTCIYISKTMKMGEDGLLGPALNQIIDTCDLRDSKGHRINWKSLENGSQILVRGLSNTKDPDVIRGHKAKVVVIDEFFHLHSELLEYLMNEVLKPMQLDYAADFTTVLIGTPPRIRGTFGEKMWNELKAPHFMWTAQDNPYIKDFDAFIDRECEEKGVDKTHPFIRREYFGEWAYDEDALLYPVYHTWNEELVPRFSVDRVLIGLDYGTSDSDAIVATAWDSSNRRGFVFYEEKFNRLTCPRDVTQLEFLKKCCREVWEYSLDFWHDIDKPAANSRITWDADSSDGHLTEELAVNLRCRYPELRMNIGTAHKHDKVLMQDKMRDLFRTACLLLPENGRTATECDMTVLKRDMQGNILLDVDDKVYHPDLLPALRYSLWDVLGLEVIRNRTGDGLRMDGEDDDAS